jgi:hypothetical protein
MGRGFESAADFAGNFEGHYDGRLAHLQIDTVRQGGQVEVGATFIDKSRDEVFEVPTYSIAVDTHLIQNLRPWRPDQDEQLTLEWQSLILHTWDIDYISGVSTWDGKLYGMSFTRIT